MLLMAAFAVFAAILVFKNPVSINPEYIIVPPDEPTRISIPRFIFENGYLPHGDEADVILGGYGGSYAYFPGFSYIFMALFMKIASLFGAGEAGLVIAARLVNLIIGLFTCHFVWNIGKLLFEKSPFRLMFFAMTMFLPQIVYVNTYVNLDSIAICAISVILYFLLGMKKKGVSVRSTVGLAVGIVLATLSYYNTYGIILGGALFFPFLFIKDDAGTEGRKSRSDTKKMVRFGLIVVGVWCVGALWWFVRNAILHNGDFLGMRTLREAQTLFRELTGVYPTPTPFSKGQPIYALFTIKGLMYQFFASFVGVYGCMNIFATKLFYLVYLAIFFAGAVLFVIFGKKSSYSSFYGMLILDIAITYGLWYIYCYAFDYQFQGRYLLPAAIPMFMIVSKGYERLTIRMESKWEGANYIPYILTGVLFGLFLYYYVFVAMKAYALV